MFEKIVIRRSNKSSGIDVGIIAECLLFYRKSHILLDHGSLISLIDQLNIHGLIDLLERPEVESSYSQKHFGTQYENPGGLFDFVVFERAAGPQKTLSAKQDLEISLERKLGKSKLTKQYFNMIDRHISYVNHNTGEISTSQIKNDAISDLKDARFVQEAAALALREFIPDWSPPAGWFVRVEEIGNRRALLTNLDFKLINSLPGKTIEGDINVSHVIDLIWQGHATMYFASKYMSEIIDSDAATKIVRAKIKNLISRRDQSMKDINLFQEVAINNGKNIRETINSGNRSFQEFLTLLDKAGKFKEMIDTSKPDSSLLQAYVNEASKKNWIETLPVKVLRFVTATGLSEIAGLLTTGTPGVGSAAGMAIGAADAFLLDKIRVGWRPHQFVQGPLTSFVSS